MFKKIFFVLTIFFFLVSSPVLAVKYGDGNYGVGKYGVTDMPAASGNNSPASNENHKDPSPGAKTSTIYGAIAESGNSIRLYFTPADGPLDKYVLQYGTKSGEYPYGVQNLGVNSQNQMTFLVESLSPNTTYFFRIRAGNGNAAGNWSNEISARTGGFISFNQLSVTNFDLETLPEEKTSTSDKTSDEDNVITEKIDENGYTVNIKVQDVNKKPVSGAKVEIHSDPKMSTTDEKGIAKFEGVEKGNHRILIAYGNFKGEQSINLTGDVKKFNLNITVTEEKIAFSLQAKIIIGILLLVIAILAIVLVKKRGQL